MRSSTNNSGNLMNLFREYVRYETRRQFLSNSASFLGTAALASLAPGLVMGETPPALTTPVGPHFAPKAKQVIYLHMVGGPPQMDLYDYKPKMEEYYDKDLPESIRNGQRL